MRGEIEKAGIMIVEVRPAIVSGISARCRLKIFEKKCEHSILNFSLEA